MVADEELIVARCGIQPGEQGSTQSVTVPGHSSAYMKICCLGSAFARFASLTSLDVSRNRLATLEGLEGLGSLVRLNVYYNLVADFAHLGALTKNKCLADLDFRLVSERGPPRNGPLTHHTMSQKPNGVAPFLRCSAEPGGIRRGLPRQVPGAAAGAAATGRAGRAGVRAAGAREPAGADRPR